MDASILAQLLYDMRWLSLVNAVFEGTIAAIDVLIFILLACSVWEGMFDDSSRKRLWVAFVIFNLMNVCCTFGCEITVLRLVSKYQASEIAENLYEARCFTVGQGSETVFQIKAKIEAVKVFGYVEIAVACFGLVVSLVMTITDWREMVEDAYQSRNKQNKALKLIVNCGVSLIEAALAFYDKFGNIEPLYAAFTKVMASFGGAPLETGVTCVEATSKAFELVSQSSTTECNSELWQDLNHSHEDIAPLWIAFAIWVISTVVLVVRVRKICKTCGRKRENNETAAPVVHGVVVGGRA